MDSNGHQVHTGAVFVTVNNAPVRASVEDANFYVDWMDNLLTKTSPGGDWNSYFPTNLAAAQARYQAAKAIYQQIALEAGGQPGPLTITTTSLANGTQNVPYSASLAANGGTPPYTWSITSGSLPTGLGLDSGTGVISGTPTATGAFSFTVKVTDSASPAQTATKSLSIFISSQTGPFTIWNNSTVPSVVSDPDPSAVEIGVKFRSDVDGFVTGLRFYKSAENTGTHTGNLWASNGTPLATVTFTNETASGWQEISLSTPVAIAANTTYVASYYTTVGHYSANEEYFTSSGYDNPPLHALANGVDGPNGVYQSGTSGFPTQTYNATNYWVDVVFSTSGPIQSFTISGTVTVGGNPLANVVMSGLPGSPVTNASGVYTGTVSYNWSGTVTPTLAGYNFTPATRSYTNVQANQTAQNYTATLQSFTISGTVTPALANVVMSGLPGSPVTNASGVYTGTVSYNWSGR